jgi:hypothetical protein
MVLMKSFRFVPKPLLYSCNSRDYPLPMRTVISYHVGIYSED